MGEGVRLINSFYIEDQPNQPTLQPQHPHPKTTPEKTLKETPPNNNIENTIMESHHQNVLDYLLSSEMGEINNKKLKIGEKTYNFERNKPLTQRLKTKFNKIRQTIEYNKIELKEKRDKKWVSLDKNKALTGIQKRYNHY